MRKREPDVVHGLLEEARRRWPDDIAIRTKQSKASFIELYEMAMRFAGWIRKQGVLSGDRVMIESENAIETAVMILGTLMAGAAFCPTHPDLPSKRQNYIRTDSGARLFIYKKEGAYVAETENERNLLPHSIFSVEKPMKEGEPETDLPTAISEDLACIIYTSGSTGLPKGVTCLHRQMCFAIDAIDLSLDYRKSDTIFVALPLSFDYGLYQLFLGLRSGACIYLASPHAAGPSIVRELKLSEATVLPAVPSILDNLALLTKRKASGLEKLRLITNTGAAASRSTVTQLRNVLMNVQFQLMYGLTECKRATICPPDADKTRPNSSGKALRGTEIFIIDDDGNRLAPGQVGQIVVRGPHLMAGYWKNRALTEKRYIFKNATMRELHTGDFGALDAEGHLYVEGRRDDIFKQHGYRVSCSEIEAAARNIDEVVEAIMVPPKGKKSGHLFVRLKSERIDVLTLLKGEIEDYKIPSKCIVLDRLPTNFNGKLDRTQLSENFQLDAI